jgi:hypothetical protein
MNTIPDLTGWLRDKEVLFVKNKIKQEVISDTKSWDRKSWFLNSN